MAVSKSFYAEQGRDDAHAGNQSRRPAIPGTWQYRAYMDAWEAYHDEKAAPKGELVKAFQAVLGEPYKVRALHRKADAMLASHKRKQHLNSFKVSPPPKKFLIPAHEDVRRNVKRGNAWD